MLLTITNTRSPATDLGYLLHKNPTRVQSFPLAFGQAHVFYPEVGEERCTVALALEVDSVGLVRGGRGGGEGGLLDQFVNDRPYAASSFLSVAISQVLGSALAGRSRERADLVDQPLPLEARLAAVPSRGGADLLRRLFEPLGYTVEVEGQLLDAHFPEWGASPYFVLTLLGQCRLRDLLRHLYVLVPVLDDDKHYWVGDEEVDKLLRHGEGWLAGHPEREVIARRYLKHRRSLAREALARLNADEEPAAEDAPARVEPEAAIEAPLRLHDLRLAAVLAELKAAGARRVLDLGCGEGRLLKLLLDDGAFAEIVGLDVSHRALEIARDRLNLDRLPAARRERITLRHGALTYADRRLEGFDAAAVVEVVEHLDPPRLGAFERVLFERARPATVVLTTPNREHNARYPQLAAGQLRHRDHRFEWTRAEFQAWADRVGERFGYAVRLAGIGPEDPEVGAPTQMAVFSRIPAPGAGGSG